MNTTELKAMSDDIPEYIGTPAEHRVQFQAWAAAFTERVAVEHPILAAVAKLDLVPDTTGDFECPFDCGISGLIYPSFPHEHAAHCPISLARQLTQENRAE